MSIQSISSSPTGNVANLASAPRSGTSELSATTDTSAAKATTATQQANPAQNNPASRQQLDDAVKAVSTIVGTVNNSLEFSVDDNSGKTVVKIVDTGTKEIIRQIPSEEMLAIAKALDGIKGLLVRQKA